MKTQHTDKAPKIRAAMERELERFASEDGCQRGMFIDTAGKLRCERVSATSTHLWLFKTQAGKPYNWNEACPHHVKRDPSCHICARISQALTEPLRISAEPDGTGFILS